MGKEIYPQLTFILRSLLHCLLQLPNNATVSADKVFREVLNAPFFPFKNGEMESKEENSGILLNIVNGLSCFLVQLKHISHQ